MSVEEDRQVAQTILQQLGGQRFIAMTGARNLVFEKKCLYFRLPRANKGIKIVRIRLMPSDTYEVKFVKQARSPSFEETEVASYDDVYAENLRGVFEAETGLATSLGTMRPAGSAVTSMSKVNPPARRPRLTR